MNKDTVTVVTLEGLYEVADACIGASREELDSLISILKQCTEMTTLWIHRNDDVDMECREDRIELTYLPEDKAIICQHVDQTWVCQFN